MYQIYDLSLSREIVASLAYVALTAGIKFSDKNQFNNIIYKLYKYLEADINFNGGIVITESLKSKLTEFKTDYSSIQDPADSGAEEELYCTFPKLAQNDAYAPFLNDEYITIDNIISSESNLYTIPYKFFCVPKTSSDYCSVQLEFRYKANGVLTKAIKYAPYQTFSDLDYWTLSVGVNTAKTAYTVVRNVYNTSGSLIKSETLTYSTSYSPSNYDIRIYKVYGDSFPVECWKIVEGFNIKEENLSDIDVSGLNIGSSYFANDFYEYENIKKEIHLHSLTGKVMDGAVKDKVFEEIDFLSKTASISNSNNNNANFAIILKNDTNNEHYAFLSDYPLYYTDISGNDGLWGINGGVSSYFKVFYSVDGTVWNEYLGTVTNATKSVNSFYVQSKPAYISGFKIFYSNYPIFYSYIDYATALNLSETAPCTLEEAIEHLNNNSEASLLNIEPRANNYTSLIKFKDSDVDFPLNRLPLGAELKLGKHKIEDSIKFPLLWKPLDYVNKMIGGNAKGDYPRNTVLMQTSFAIDALPLGVQNSMASTPLDLLPFQRWANSEATAGNWWEAVYEGELEPDAKNCVLNGQYSHRAGFLNSWAQEEKNLLVSITTDGYTNQKILNLNSSESPYVTTYAYRPRLALHFGVSGNFVDNPYFTKHISKHLNYKTISITELDSYISSLTVGGAYWRRQKDTSNVYRYGYTYSASTKEGYNILPIVPICCVKDDVIVKRESDADGKYSLDIEITEDIEIQESFKTSRKVIKNITQNFEAKRKIIENVEKTYNVIRKLGMGSSSTFTTERIIRKNVINKFNVDRVISSNIERRFSTARFINYLSNFKFPTERDIVKISDVTFPLVRKITKEEAVSVTFDILRDILNSADFMASAVRFVQKNYTNDKETCRSIINDITIINENFKREVVENMSANYPTKRFITSDTDKYVSKANLILYTQLLKEQIAQYIDVKIAEEFTKRNL